MRNFVCKGKVRIKKKRRENTINKDMYCQTKYSVHELKFAEQ